jgi:hypothetical protein
MTKAADAISERRYEVSKERAKLDALFEVAECFDRLEDAREEGHHPKAVISVAPLGFGIWEVLIDLTADTRRTPIS